MKPIVTLAATAWAVALGVAFAQTTSGVLPLDNFGIEDLDIVVPDTAASARF